MSRPRLARTTVRDVVDDERQDEEVERVERPAEKAGEDGVALVRRSAAVRCFGDTVNAECRMSSIASIQHATAWRIARASMRHSEAMRFDERQKLKPVPK